MFSNGSIQDIKESQRGKIEYAVCLRHINIY